MKNNFTIYDYNNKITIYIADKGKWKVLESYPVHENCVSTELYVTIVDLLNKGYKYIDFNELNDNLSARDLVLSIKEVAGVKQAQIAKETGLSKSLITKLLNDSKKDGNDETLNRLKAYAYKVGALEKKGGV